MKGQEDVTVTMRGCVKLQITNGVAAEILLTYRRQYSWVSNTNVSAVCIIFINAVGLGDPFVG